MALVTISQRLAAAAVAWLVLFVFAPAAVVLANHSATNPPWRWDIDNDGVWEATDSIQSYGKGGAGWDANKINRATEGVQRWAVFTDWNPWFNNIAAAPRAIWQDGTAPNLASPCGTWAQEGNPLALNCVVGAPKQGWVRIVDSDIFLNTNAHPFDWGVVQNNAFYSARGVIVHETGHGAMLNDVPWWDCNPLVDLITMCDNAGKAESWALWTLTNDDINSANVMYPP